jgi:hypothetical protein
VNDTVGREERQLPVPAGPARVVPAGARARQPNLARRHPFGFLGAAFFAGAVLGTVRSLHGHDLYRSVKRRLT